MAELSPEQVLVVEDHPLIRIVAVDALTEHGIVAWEAGSAQDALEALADHPAIGLVFTDVNMPGKMSGPELISYLQKARPDVELIVTSGAVTDPDEELANEGSFLLKPYTLDSLVELVDKKLHRHVRQSGETEAC